MSRGVSQSLYRYLPDSWIDFSVRGDERHNYIAKVRRWNGEPLDGVNKPRLIRTVNQKLRQFSEKSNAEGPTKIKPISGFGSSLTEENCNVLIPKYNTEERGIVADLDPLTFYCPACHKVYQFKTKEKYDRIRGKCLHCNIVLKQIRLVYYCKCGWSSSHHKVYCPTCKSPEHILWSGRINDYVFHCGKCHKSIQMVAKCQQCDERITPRVALDSSQYYPKTFDLIDIIDEKAEKFISEVEEGAYLTIARWLEIIRGDELEALIEKGKLTDSEEYQKCFNSLYNVLVAAGIDEESARAHAKIEADKQCGSAFAESVDSLKSKILTSKDECNYIAEEILEYIRMGELTDYADLSDAATTAKLLNTSANSDKYIEIASEFGLSNAKVFGDIPFITCSYGYTRIESEPKQGVQLRAFTEEKPGTKNIYATKLKTEGVLFEFDRRKILKWLEANNIISLDEQLDLNNEDDVKLWFINHINNSAIRPFDQIDSVAEKDTFYVYSLLHSISHVMIKSAAYMCGLSKDSLSEYIMPNIPAILIYCQNSQGFSLGALYNLFEAYFDKWLLKSKEVAEKCIFDPICIERYKACGGCLYLNEISCQHFNHDLDRTFIIGHYDRSTRTKLTGFWEK